ncbi:Cupin domain protein [Poriferisphaera corsica]|uniref:Cupin domain protein n=1 Tax=Poriferisphaera corsica TaxID=2528020 RepID=A0A517YX75_9BACT|nr:cupin domain-containing protein [Poriferisphaera corsica]QDU34819.1 Cupin domain protein [Poriferisphaera corsica]
MHECQDGNWLDVQGLGERLPKELFETICKGSKGFRLERIVSEGQASPEGFWYEQEQAEWVMIVQGEAGLLFADADQERVMRAGDYVYIEPCRRHRVTWTSPTEKTIWLAIFFDT